MVIGQRDTRLSADWKAAGIGCGTGLDIKGQDLIESIRCRHRGNIDEEPEIIARPVLGNQPSLGRVGQPEYSFDLGRPFDLACCSRSRGFASARSDAAV